MKKVKVQRLSHRDVDLYENVDALTTHADGQMLSIKMANQEVLIPITNIDYVVEEEM